ncbi:MAG: TonB-dependent receptor [Paramuribaculum sp.]|nr:TonB-dependent receptor [Paramuribaculum sp.]
MKRSILFLFTFLLVSLASNAQKVTVRAVDEPAAEVFRNIMSQTGMNFVYSSDILKDMIVNIDVKNQPLKKVLSRIFKETGISYKVKGNNVILVKDKTKKRETAKIIKPKTERIITTDTIIADLTVNLDEVTVRATGADRNLKAAEMGRHVIGSEMITKLPVLLGEPDVIKTLQTLPGVAQGVEGFSGLYVHGGENDQNLFLYNGLPVYHVAHLGGIFSAFNVSTIRKVDFFKSAFPARFGDRISSVTDITMNEPDFTSYTGKFTVGLLAANAYVTGPIVKERLAFSAGVRRSWVDVVGLPALAIFNAIQKKNGKKTIASYSFTDFNARIDWRLGSGKLYAIGYYGHDYLKIGLRQSQKSAPEDYSQVEPSSLSSLSDGAANTSYHYEENSNRLAWGNWGVSVNADYRVGKGSLNAVAYFTKYSSRFTQQAEHQLDTNDPLSYGLTYDATYNSIADIGLKAQYMKQWDRLWLLKAGAAIVHHNYHPEGLVNRFMEDGKSWTENNGNPSVKSMEASAYLDNLINFGDRASLDVGLRFVNMNISGKSFPRLEPRASVRINITQDYSVKASYARINQFIQQVSPNYINLPTDLWQPIGEGKEPLSSDQYSVGFYGNLSRGTFFSIEGWYKDMRNLLEFREGISTLNPNLTWDEKTVSGRGWAYGIDLSVTKELGKVVGSISYGLMWNWRKFSQLNEGVKFPAKFDNRHKININASYRLNDKIEFNAGWTYMTGNRLTISLYDYPSTGEWFPQAPTDMGDFNSSWWSDNLENASGVGYISERNNVRLPAYHRLDIGMSLFKKLKNGNRTIWNFSLYNAYCRMNPITIVKDGWVDFTFSNKKFRKLSLLPIIPSISWTYEF